MNSAEMPHPVTVSPPVSVAVIVHEASGDHVATFDLMRGQMQPLTSDASNPKGLTFSYDGKWLAYASGTSLWLHREGSAGRVLFENLDSTAEPPYAFQPGAAIIAVVSRGSVQLLPLLDSSAASAPSLRFSLANGCRASQLLWSQSGDVLYVLCAPPPRSKQPWIVAITPATGAMKELTAPGVSRLLGFRSGGELIVSRTVGAGDEALLAARPGEYQPLRAAKENEFIAGYIGASAQFVVVEGSEDGGDRTVFCLADSGPCNPWLRAFRRIADLSFSPDGRWAFFIERPAMEGDLPGGDVYFAATHGTETRRILEATQERKYSSPVMRPNVH